MRITSDRTLYCGKLLHLLLVTTLKENPVGHFSMVNPSSMDTDGRILTGRCRRRCGAAAAGGCAAAAGPPSPAPPAADRPRRIAGSP